MSQDSASIYAITVLAMVFVPGNFTAVRSAALISTTSVLIISGVVLLCCVPSHRIWRHGSHGLALTVYTYNSNLNIDRDYTVVIS
jgi:hypothetical protein